MYVGTNQFWNNTEKSNGKFTKCGVKLRYELIFFYLKWGVYQLGVNLEVILMEWSWGI
jgi:hypothetical protein